LKKTYKEKLKILGRYKKVFWVFISVTFFVLFVFYLSQGPSNNKNWETGFDVSPNIQIKGDSFTIKNLRNWKYTKTDVIGFDYINQTYNFSQVEKAWFLVEPFSNNWEAVAHTYFVFDFKDGRTLALSIEARREKGENYNIFLGLFKKYELFYVWGTEEDLTGTRAVQRDHNIYMYPINISVYYTQELLKSLVFESSSLDSTPKFYNSITSNCTNNLAKAANRVNPKAIPNIYYYTLPGNSINKLVKLGYLPADSLENKSDYNIKERVKKHYGNENFSSLIR